SLIAYDVCDPVNLCGDDNSVAAVEQAIEDQSKLKSSWGAAYKGMVLNFSIGGSDDAYGDPVEQAFLSATEAGIYVSAAGGNGGPANAVTNDPVNAPQYPVQHMGPWEATLAAATHDGTFSNNLLENFSGGDATTRPAVAMAGDGATTGFGPEPLVYSGNFSDPVPSSCPTEPSAEGCPASQGAAPDSQQCLFPFAPGTFTASEIVVCDRGTNPLVDKAYNVQQGGGAGMVIATTSTSSQDMVVEPYVIPATLLDLSDGDTLRAWLNASSGTPASAGLSGSHLTTDSTQADQVAGFSSRGPTDTGYDDLVKPDLAAPGVSVLAAVSNPAYTVSCSGSCSNQPETFDFYDGTSMATPHDTGAAALLMQAHPLWSAAEVKSALMLTAVTAAVGTSPGLIDQCASLDSGLNCIAGSAVPSPQVRGAGRIDVDAAERAGLVLDETGADYEAADPDKGGDLTVLNLASLGNSTCGGSCTWTRKLSSSFTASDVQYTVVPSGVSNGVSITVTPSSFTLVHGGTQTLTVTADTSGLAVGQWGFAQLDISAGGGAVGDAGAAIPPMHLTVAVKASVPVAQMSVTPAQLDFDGNGSQRISISNKGRQALHWSLASTAAVASGNAPAHAPAPLSSLWDQPDANKDQGYQSSFYTEVNHGIYAADSFVLPAKALIKDLVAGGFAEDQSGPLSVTGEVDWYIY
ncbi:MAG TPA: S8 family serine peptidase, partial [Gammaproteobacteria bacterium]